MVVWPILWRQKQNKTKLSFGVGVSYMKLNESIRRSVKMFTKFTEIYRYFFLLYIFIW